MKSKRGFSTVIISVFFFSAFLVLLAEYIHFCNISEVFSLITRKPCVIFFCTTIIFFTIMSAVWLTSSVKIGSILVGVFVFVLAVVEFYKFDVSGSHLAFADILFASDFEKITGFAMIRPEVHLFKAAAALALAIVGLWFVKFPRFGKRGHRFLAFGISVVITLTLFVPSFGYKVSGFDSKPALTLMRTNERFENDGFVASFIQDAREYTGSGIEEPTGYSQELMKKYQRAADANAAAKKPNVVVILSESFADLRDVSDEDLFGSVYDKYDEALGLSSVSKTRLPTFGGYTVRSEFELLFGLPVMSMSNLPAPHTRLEGMEKQNTIVQEYLKNGYSTTYIHPYIETFYDRNEIYPSYGFSNMIFEDAFDTEKDTYRSFVSDLAVVEKIKEQLIEDTAPSFIFAMTMQNHQPYAAPDGKFEGELDYYLGGVEKSSEAIYELLRTLESFPEETIVLFLGDHFPFFSPQGGVYRKLDGQRGLSEDMYTQKYILYSNRERLKLPEDEVSLFYLPHLLYEKTGLPKCGFTNMMLEYMETKPIYSIAGYDGSRSEFLDAVTYDRVFGECYVK